MLKIMSCLSKTMQKNIQVKSVSIKKQGTNEKTGKDWTLYTVECSGDDEMNKFSTFNQQYMNSEGQQMTGNFEYDTKWKNWQEVSAAQAEATDKHDEIMNAIREVWTKLDNIEKNMDWEDVTFDSITPEDIAEGDGKVPSMSDIPYETQRDDKATGDDK